MDVRIDGAAFYSLSTAVDFLLRRVGDGAKAKAKVCGAGWCWVVLGVGCWVLGADAGRDEVVLGEVGGAGWVREMGG